MDSKIDLKEKRHALDSLWFDVFELCQATVSAAKRGETVLRGSLLKELTCYLRELELVLDRLKQEQGEDDDDELLKKTAEIIESIDFGEMGSKDTYRNEPKTEMNKPLDIK